MCVGRVSFAELFIGYHSFLGLTLSGGRSVFRDALLFLVLLTLRYGGNIGYKV